MSKELLKANSGLSSRIVSMMPSRASAKTAAREMTQFHMFHASTVLVTLFCEATFAMSVSDILLFSC